METIFPIAYFTLIMIIGGAIMSKKFRSFILAVIFTAVFIFFLCAAQNAARAEITNGYITRVAPEIINGYPVLIITVETIEGEVYTYFSETEIDTIGEVDIEVVDNKVVNVW